MMSRGAGRRGSWSNENEVPGYVKGHIRGKEREVVHINSSIASRGRTGASLFCS